MPKPNRLSICIAAFGLILVAAFVAALVIGSSQWRELQVNGPTYGRIVAEKDLLADALPPPLYVTEAYTEATLVLEDSSAIAQHAARLAELHRQYEGRYDYWAGREVDPAVRKLLEESHTQVAMFWDAVERDFLPAAMKADLPAAQSAYGHVTEAFRAHRAIIDRLANVATAKSRQMEAEAARHAATVKGIVWLITTLLVLGSAFCISAIVLWVIRPRERWLATVVSALDSSQDRIAIEDESGRIVYANHALRAVAPRDLHDVLGSRLDEIFPHVRGGSAGYERVRHAIRQQGAWRGEVWFDRSSGESVLYDLRLVKTQNDGILFVGTDITETKAREQRELDLQTRLSQAEKMAALGRLAGGIAHDFNNILGAIRSFGDLLADGLEAGSRPHGYATRIVGACDRAADVVRQILLFSGVKEAPRELVRIADLVGEVSGLVTGKLGTGVTLSFANVMRDAIVVGNAAQLSRVLMNVIINANDALAGRNGEIMLLTAELTVNEDQPPPFEATFGGLAGGSADGFVISSGILSAQTRYLRISVADTGAGIAPSVANRMFDPFFTTKDKRRGPGLGLAVVNSIVVAHQGAVAVQSSEGVGTTFHIYLPVHKSGADADLGPQLKVERVPVAGSRQNLRGGERILIVDDEIDMADAFSHSLTNLGYETAPVYSPLEALEVFQEDPAAWDLVVTDQAMPAMTGLELISRLKSIRPGLKAILCTGYSDDASEATAFAAGADAYFNKPLDIETLARAIRGLMEKAGKRQSLPLSH